MSATPYMKSSALIASIQRRINFPLNQSTYQTADLLAFANEEIAIGLLPGILSVHEEFYATSISVPLKANVSRYIIPYRAIGGKLRDIFYMDASGSLIEMTRMSPDDRAFFGSNGNYNSGSRRFYLEGDEVVLLPPVNSNPVGSLVMSFYLRPNQLVDETRAGFILSMSPNAINPSTQTDITLDNLPTNIISGSLVDLLQTLPGHKNRAWDKNVVNVNTTTKTLTLLTSDIPADLAIGDYIAAAGECVIPQIPADLHVVLAQRVAARILDAQGDAAGLQSANQKLSEMETKGGALIDNRTEGAPQKVVNLRGILRASRLGRRGGN